MNSFANFLTIFMLSLSLLHQSLKSKTTILHNKCTFTTHMKIPQALFYTSRWWALFEYWAQGAMLFCFLIPFSCTALFKRFWLVMN